ncbi:MAG: hypothetical protein AB7F32_12225 [Victivallaceae bacterium]
MAEARKTPLALELAAGFIWLSSLVSLGISAFSVYAADHTDILTVLHHPRIRALFAARQPEKETEK